jgi:hypothetical protein
MSRLLRADITEEQQKRLRVLAAERGVPIQWLIAQALATAPATREAFQTKETK